MKQKARAEPNCGNYDHRCINESAFEGSEVRRKLILSEEEKFWGGESVGGCDVQR
jgi:hypothetical protein